MEDGGWIVRVLESLLCVVCDITNLLMVKNSLSGERPDSPREEGFTPSDPEDLNKLSQCRMWERVLNDHLPLLLLVSHSNC